MEQGTPFALAHTFLQTGPFRPNNVNRKVPGLVFTGSSTLPGVGVPMVLVSGKLAAAARRRVRRRRGAERDGAPVRRRSAAPPTPTTHLLPDGPVTLDESYALCREFNKRHGTTYYWSTKVLPKVKQHHVHALYAFARYADDIVDEIPSQGGRDVPIEERAAALADFGDRFFADLAAGRSDDPVLKAVVHTVRAFDIDTDAFRRFLRSMTMDLTVDVVRHVGRSARVRRRLGRGDRGDDAADPRTDRLRRRLATRPRSRRGVPAHQLPARHRRGPRSGPPVHPARGQRDGSASTSPTGGSTPAFVELMRFEIDRCRELYESADLGIALLPDRSAKCVGAARVLYSRILDKIEAQHYDVFSVAGERVDSGEGVPSSPDSSRLATDVRCRDRERVDRDWHWSPLPPARSRRRR